MGGRGEGEIEKWTKSVLLTGREGGEGERGSFFSLVFVSSGGSRGGVGSKNGQSRFFSTKGAGGAPEAGFDSRA